MKRIRTLGNLVLMAAVTTALWIVLLILYQTTTPPVETLADQISVIESNWGLFVLNYLNAGMITIFTTAAMAGLYQFCRDGSPIWAAVGLVFVPMYGLVNSLVYFAQIFVLPRLIELYHVPETAAAAEVFLRLAVHQWSGSAAAFANALAYAFLGVPSILFGILLVRKAPALRIGGILLALSGLLSLVAFFGIGIGSPALAMMTLVGGAVFLVALVMISFVLLRAR